jgi:hypothetical protein
MSKSAPIYRYQIRVLAGKLENGSLSEVEKAGLAKMLRELGDGLTVDEIFNIENKPHRPQGMELEQRIFDVAVLQLPEKHGGGGLTKVKAIEEVAKIYNKSANTIEDDYKSDRGKKIRALVKSNYYNPLATDN